MIDYLGKHYGREARKKTKNIYEADISGARALIETFYYAFNQRDIVTLSQVWVNHDLAQLYNPLGNILRGSADIMELYQLIFTGSGKVWVEFHEVVEYQTSDMVVFAGRERGEYTQAKDSLKLSIRTTRVVQWFGEQIGWKLTHHHGSIDDPGLLAKYQSRVKGV